MIVVCGSGTGESLKDSSEGMGNSMGEQRGETREHVYFAIPLSWQKGPQT